MKKNIAIIAGGFSGEFAVSKNSADVVFRNLNRDYYRPFIIMITQEEWYYSGENNQKAIINRQDFSLQYKGETIRFDAVFNAIHGTPGEDGTIQGYFDMLRIPYTSSSLAASALTFNKSFCKSVIRSYGLPTSKWVHLYRDTIIHTKEILEEVGLPCFVKPNKGGSSVGMTKVKKDSELKLAIKKAFEEDDEVIIEQFIEGTEITCGLLKDQGKVRVLSLCEIVSKNEFFDYEAKYTPGMADEIVPARVSDAIELKCKSTSVYLYNKLNCQGLVRMDYIVEKDSIKSDSPVLSFLEINTVPGLSVNSIVPKMARFDGVSLTYLYTMMLEDCLCRGK